MKVVVKGEEVLCVKSILTHSNRTFKKLIEDEKFSGVLELCDGCDIEVFLEIEKYYSGGTMELNEANICKTLLFCIYYDDSLLLKKCKKYVKSHLNDSLMIELFKILHEINCRYVNDLKEMCEEYIQKNGYKYLQNDELLLKLKIEDLEFILNCNNLIIENENWLLNRLIRWKNEIKNVFEKENDENELKEEFMRLLKKYIHFEKINMKELSNETVNEIKELDLYNEICRVNHISIDLKEIKNDKVKEIIYKYYIEEDKTEIEEEDIKALKENNLQEIISILLNKDDIKLNEIGLLMIMDGKIDYKIVEKENKSVLLLKLLYNYERKSNNRIVKCLCLFVDDKKHILTIEDLCGKEILFKLLNYHYYLSEETNSLLIGYIHEIGLSKEEENVLLEIIKDDKIIEELLIKEISSFSYPQSEYSFVINEEISIIPSFDGNRCEFSISPSLPSGIEINKENGIINGKVSKKMNKREYEISCKNIRNEKKFKISLEFNDIKFTELHKSDGISISNNGKLITKTSGSRYVHSYLNLKMEKGIYHIKYKFIKRSNGSNNYDNLMIGLSTDNTFSGVDIYNQSTTCSYYARSCAGSSSDCHIGTVVNSNPNFNNHGDGSVYEIIVDMNKREYWISHNNSSPVLLVKDLPSPLYPYISIYPINNSVELISVSQQD